MNIFTNWWGASSKESPLDGDLKAITKIQEASLDPMIHKIMQEDSIPGLAILVISRGEVILSKGYGQANLELQVPVDSQTMFQSGSVGKMFTAAGVMILVEDGVVGLDDSILKYLPEGPECWKPITLRNLLTHTSGIPDYNPQMLNYQRNYSQLGLINFAAGLKLNFPAGTKWSYSNTGYILLGIILDRQSGRPYWHLLKERIWKPAKMPSVCINHPSNIVKSRASGYLVVQSPESQEFFYRNQNWVSPTLSVTADGSLLLSLDDFVAWNEVVRTRTVLSRKSWEEVLSPVKLKDGATYPYGFGWYVDKIGNYSVHEHSGGWQGFRTYFRRYSDLDLAIAVLANSCQANTKKITNQVAELLNPNLVPQSEI